MTHALTGKRIAFLVANSGVEQAELAAPWQAVQDAGGQPFLLAPEQAGVATVNHDVEPGETFSADLAVSDASAADYDALVLPGGLGNPDKLRLNADAVSLIREFATTGKPIAAICHAPWTLVEAGVVAGKTLTSWPSLQTDIRNAGGDWRDEQVRVCTMQGYTLITSRKPDDLDAFTAAVVDQFGDGSAFA